MATVKLYFEWTTFQPDQRTYRQNSVHLYPLLDNKDDANQPKIAVQVPLEGKYIDNCEDIIIKQTSGEPAPYPVLTIEGMKYVYDLFDAIFYKTEAPEDTSFVGGPHAKDDDEWAEPAKDEVKKDDDDWNADWPENPANNPAPVAVGPEQDEWAEATGTDKDAKWDEQEEKWE